tara:strand:- start:10070 stop:10393 length:324 start_codon:yes stop_codon:yes gene_type:complete
MKTIKNSNKGNNNTLDILDAIQEVDLSPFFKNKVLNKIAQQKEVKEPSFSWFSPQLQLATLAVLICFNVGTIYYSISYTKNTQEQLSDFEYFVQEYNFESNNSISIN